MTFFINLIDPSSGGDLQIEYLPPGAGVTFQDGILSLAIAVFDFVSPSSEFLAKETQAGAHRLHMGQLLYRFRIIVGKLLTLAYLFRRPAKRDRLVIRENDVRPQAADDLADVVVQTSHHGRDANHDGDPDHDSEHSECRPQFVGADGVQRHLDDLAVIASAKHKKLLNYSITQLHNYTISQLLNLFSQFKSQGRDRIKFRRSFRREHAKEHTHAGGNQQPGAYRPQFDLRRHPDDRRDAFGECNAKQHAQQATDQRHSSGLDQELQQNILASRSHRFSY